MAQLLISDLAEPLLKDLQRRASAHGRTPEAEARAILSEVLQGPPSTAWGPINAIRERLAASGRSFGDSTELLREDRDR